MSVKDGGVPVYDGLFVCDVKTMTLVIQQNADFLFAGTVS